MQKETSAGAIVYRREDKKIKYLLLHKEASNHYRESWDFPKGLVEEKEKPIKTAERETKEEAGIKKLRFNPKFKEKIHFFYKREGELISKGIVFFLAETEQIRAKVSFEHKGYKWCSFNEAVKLLTFKNSREILKRADDFLKKGLTNWLGRS